MRQPVGKEIRDPLLRNGTRIARSVDDGHGSVDGVELDRKWSISATGAACSH
jgi:hypothetical protein